MFRHLFCLPEDGTTSNEWSVCCRCLRPSPSSGLHKIRRDTQPREVESIPSLSKCTSDGGWALPLPENPSQFHLPQSSPFLMKRKTSSPRREFSLFEGSQFLVRFVRGPGTDSSTRTSLFDSTRRVGRPSLVRHRPPCRLQPVPPRVGRAVGESCTPSSRACCGWTRRPRARPGAGEGTAAPVTYPSRPRSVGAVAAVGRGPEPEGRGDGSDPPLDAPTLRLFGPRGRPRGPVSPRREGVGSFPFLRVGQVLGGAGRVQAGPTGAAPHPRLERRGTRRARSRARGAPRTELKWRKKCKVSSKRN